MADLTLHHPAHSLDRHHGVATEPNQFEARSYRGERISQFVRQQRQELVFPGIGLPQLFLGPRAFDGLPGPLRGFLDQFDFLRSPGPWRNVAHAERRDQPAVPDQRRGDERTHADCGDRRTIRLGNQRRGLCVGHDHRSARPKCRTKPFEIGQRKSTDNARNPPANKVPSDQDVALRFVYVCVVGTVCQQPLSEKPAGLA